MARFPILSDGTDATPERVAGILARYGSAIPASTVHPSVVDQLRESVDRNYRHERSFLIALVGPEAGARVIAADLANRGIARGPELAVVLDAAADMLAGR